MKSRRRFAAYAMLTIMSLSLFSTLSIIPANAYVTMLTSATLVPSTIGPGDSGNILITITNNGNEFAGDVKLKLNSHSYITFASRSYSLQNIAAGDSVQVSVPISVATNAKEGSTTVSFTLEYNEGSATGVSTSQGSISLSIVREPVIQINNVTYDKALIQRGDIVKMTVELQNVGGRANDVSVALRNYTQIFVPYGGEMKIYLGDLDQNERALAEFNFIINTDAETVAYSMPVRITYNDIDNVAHTEDRIVGLQVSGEPDFVVTMESAKSMFSGATGELTVSIANRGTAKASFLTVKFDSGFDVTPSEYYVGDLNPDDYQTVTVDVALPRQMTGRQELSLELLYKDPYNKEFTATKSVAFDVTAIPVNFFNTTNIIIIFAVVVVLYWKRKSVAGLFRRKKK